MMSSTVIGSDGRTERGLLASELLATLDRGIDAVQAIAMVIPDDSVARARVEERTEARLRTEILGDAVGASTSENRQEKVSAVPASIAEPAHWVCRPQPSVWHPEYAYLDYAE